MSKVKSEKKERKVFIKWLVLMLLGFFVGFLGGDLVMLNSEKIDVVLQMMSIAKDVFSIPFLILFALVIVVGYGYVFVKYNKAKRIVKKGYDDEAYDIAEETLAKVSVATNILSGLNYLFFGVCFYLVDIVTGEVTTIRAILSVITIILFVIGIICSIAMFHKTVKLDQRMNPEKKGNVFDKKFAAEWIGSCDEAEKALIYQSSYKAYQIAVRVATVLWGMSIVGMMGFHTGVFAVVVSSIMLIVLVSTYSVTAYKLQHKK